MSKSKLHADSELIAQKLDDLAEHVRGLHTPNGERSRRSTIRLPASDVARIHDIMRHALSMDEIINVTDAVRLALQNWDFEKRMTVEMITAMRRSDGRRKQADK